MQAYSSETPTTLDPSAPTLSQTRAGLGPGVAHARGLLLCPGALLCLRSPGSISFLQAPGCLRYIPSEFHVLFEKITQNQWGRQARKTNVAKQFLKHGYLYTEENTRELLIFTNQKDPWDVLLFFAALQLIYESKAWSTLKSRQTPTWILCTGSFFWQVAAGLYSAQTVSCLKYIFNPVLPHSQPT